MPRGEKHGNREAKKPKQDKVKASAAAASPFATPPGKTGSSGQGGKK
jgi:hypothetical protein